MAFPRSSLQSIELLLLRLAACCRAAPDAKLNDIKGLLGKMLFSGPGMEKKVEWLSGGEKARLALAKFMLTQVGLGRRRGLLGLQVFR